MNKDRESRIVIIGMGFLMEYISPCYENFVTEKNLSSQIIAITADEKSILDKQKKYPFRIILNDNLSALRELHPDIILFAVPPLAAPALAENVLKVYYDEERAANRSLPDLFAFPPTPAGKYYLDLLGEDIHVCNILPNMVKEINGVKLNGLEGNSYITYPNESPWLIENLQRIERFFSPLGEVVEVKPQHIMEVLATLVATDVIPGTIYTIYDALTSIDLDISYKDVATIFRDRLQEKQKSLPKNQNKLINQDIDTKIIYILNKYCDSWYQGLHDYLIYTGVEENSINRIVSRKLDIAIHACQEESREVIEFNAKKHATPNGVLEKGHFVFRVLMKEKLLKVISDYKKKLPDHSFYDWVYSMAIETSKIVAAKGKQLAGNAPYERFTAKTHASLFGLMVRNVIKVHGEKGREVCEEGVQLYAKQRGARMGKRAMKNGDKRTMLNYMAYGEWKPVSGTMDIRESAQSPSVVTRVYKCPWNVTWQKLGFMEEGRLYCKHVDKNLAIGFSGELNLGINGNQMEGDEYCEFIFNGAELNEKNREKLDKKRTSLGDSCIKDWEYHSMHLFSAISGLIKERFEDGEEIIDNILDDFVSVYSKNAGDILIDSKGIDFSDI